jgi:murein DD-endopeptidase MepM/ murein hydrolase activator NlpD
LHAACDLYRYKDEAMLSVAPGVVTRGLYYFYQGTYALEVKHDGGFIVRYGEVTGKSPSGTSKGSRLKMGQTLGYIAKVNSNCCNPMLHFELYKGNVTGPLSQSGNRYQRRSDLMNPTDYLLSWMKK